MRNRISGMSKQPLKVLVIQTPVGMVKIPIGQTAGMPEPVARAMKIFEAAIDRGAADPLAETMQQLQEMASTGDEAPLMASIAYINELVERAAKEAGAQRPGISTRLDEPENLN